MEWSGVALRRVPPLAVIALLLLLLLLLLPLAGVTPHKGRLGRHGRSPPKEDDAVLPTGEGQEMLEETFIVSSVGEEFQPVNMARSEEEEDREKGEEEEVAEEGGAVALQDHLFDLAFCFNLASILFFL
ncbi:sperm-egg fusion protein LLCFC1 [Tachyglossus aculeatus]|uniref:sperm-egg fusion protein LLCFC1 n=1 Tax=Tachyglossus aculeatus TaxID=9261 RepID=UPI0018F65462|nr:sperm-egg fusion protein LLCFC1 [Tachyglossus aculeatus]